MDSVNVKHIFLFSLNDYFKDLLESVERINRASKSWQMIAELQAALNSAAERALPIVVPRGDAADKRLVTSGTDFYYRNLPLVEGGPDELVAMLAMDVVELPASYAVSIKDILKLTPEPLEAVRILCFVLTKNQRTSAFQRTMMIAARTATGSLVAFPFPIHWKVGDHVVGDSLQGLNPTDEENRLNYLMYLVINQDGAMLHGTIQTPGNSLH